jgi:hypothetical protein
MVILHHIRQKVGANGKGSGDAQRASSVGLDFVNGLPCHGNGPKYLLGMRPKRFAGGRQYQV